MSTRLTSRSRTGYRNLFLFLSSFLVLVLGFAHNSVFAQDTREGPELTLAEAVRMAVENNYDIRIARNDARVARNNYSLGNAGFLPVVGLTARQNYSPLSGFAGSGGGSSNAVDVAVGLNMTVFDGLGQFATYQRLQELQSLGTLSAERVAESVLADVVILYYDIARQQQQIDVLREAIEISEERLRIAELQRDLGSSSELEVRRARVDLNADRATLLRQEVTLLNTKATFDQLLGRETGLDFTVVDTIVVDPSLSLSDLQTAALQRNRSLRNAEGLRNVAELNRREVRSEWLPRVDFQLGYAFNDLSSEIGLPISRPGGFSYGVTASLNLFEGFNRDRRLENARLEIESSELVIEDVRTRIQTETENAFENYRNSLELIALEEENLNLAQQNVSVALERFRLGTITSIELREVQNALTNIRSRLLTAQYEAKRAEITLLSLSGLLLDNSLNQQG